MQYFHLLITRFKDAHNLGVCEDIKQHIEHDQEAVDRDPTKPKFSEHQIGCMFSLK